MGLGINGYATLYVVLVLTDVLNIIVNPLLAASTPVHLHQGVVVGGMLMRSPLAIVSGSWKNNNPAENPI